MAHLPSWSNASAICRSGLESGAVPLPGHYLWRPSRICTLLLVLLTLLAPVSVLASGLAPGVAWPLALLAAVHGVRIVRTYRRSVTRDLLIPGAGAEARCDGDPMNELRVRWRGPLAFLEWRGHAGGPRQRLLFWPDVLDARARRELRLAMRAREAALGCASVAR